MSEFWKFLNRVMNLVEGMISHPIMVLLLVGPTCWVTLWIAVQVASK